MMTILTVLQVLLAIALVALILVQRGPGAAAGSGFGAGASATVFGSRGSGSFLTRATAVLATLFFVLSFAMAILVSRSIKQDASEVDLGVMSEAGTAQPLPDDEVPALDTTEPTGAVSVEPKEGVGELPTADPDETAEDQDEGEGG